MCAVVVAHVGAILIWIGYESGFPAPPAPSASASAVPGGMMPWGLPDNLAVQREPLPRSEPVRLEFARLGIDTPLMSLGLNPDQTVEVPAPTPDAPAGWYRNLAAPGEAGPAVVLGHVDSLTGPGVFYLLGASRPGDRVLVHRADGRTALFVVDRVASYPRTAFPTGEVYGPVDHAALRLVTCGGRYDRATGGYEQNVVVFASLAQNW